MSHLEEQFISLWEYQHPNIDLHREYRFHPKRRYRADFANIESKVLVEIQGGIWGRNRTGHSSGTGIERDCEKFALAASEGWLVFPLSERMITQEWLSAIASSIEARR